jgi:hypothetical protein
MDLVALIAQEQGGHGGVDPAGEGDDDPWARGHG